MATREQVGALLRGGLDYVAIGRALGIPAGQAYLTATGLPADGAVTLTREPRGEPHRYGSRGQVLVNPREVSPTGRGDVLAWMRRRAFMDEQMRQPSGGSPRHHDGQAKHGHHKDKDTSKKKHKDTT